MNGEDLNLRKEEIESMINRIETSKPFLLKAMDPTAIKEKLSKLYPDQNE
jgi:hypothetical protein